MYRISMQLRTAAFTTFITFWAASAPAQSFHQPTDVGTHADTSDMLDARVNAKDAFQHALAARPGAAQNGLVRARSTTQSVVNAVASLKHTMPGAEVRLSNLTGAPREVNGKSGPLTPPANGVASEDIARDFLSDHGNLFGLSSADVSDLVVLGDSAGGASGLRMLRMEQQIDGRPLFQSETRFLLKRDGSLVKVTGQLVPNARALAPQIDWTRALSAPEAVSALLRGSGKSADASNFSVSTTSDDGRIELSSTNDFTKGQLTARQIFFPLAPGVLVPAWSINVFTTGDQDWYAVVDAQTGDVLWRKNVRDYASAQDARFRVYVQADGTTPAPSPAPNVAHVVVAPGSGTQFPGISPTTVNMHTAYDPIFSPNGWIDDCPAGGCTANETQTLGNNVLACVDQAQGGDANICDTAAGTVLDGNGRPTGNPDGNARNRDFLGPSPRDFETGFLPPPQGGNPEAGQTATGNGTSGTAAIDQFRRGVVTHLFYSLNWYHDKMAALGFDEASGNFQRVNFSAGGVGNDRVLADVADGSGTNNANFSTFPDGTSGRMQMYRFTGPTIDRDGALDAEVFLHEATHGVSNRLIGNAAGLNWNPARGMGEGWSDFVALSLLYNSNADNPAARYASGGYATYKLIAGFTDNYVYGIRRFPYSTDNSVNPLTWADVDDVTNDMSGGIALSPVNFNGNGGLEVHNIGEIWANTLWEMRSRIIADPAGANGDVPTGNHTSLQVVVDGMKMTPVNPTFIDARDALIDADCATSNCANEASIWGGFADRGLGYRADAPYAINGRYAAGHEAVHESFSSPYLDVADPLTDISVDDSVANNNGVLDAGETVKLKIKLTNPWRNANKNVAGATATLSTTTPGVTVYQGSATYGAIAAQGSAIGTPFVVGLDSSVPCGGAIDLVLTTTSSLGTTTANFRLRIGTRNGTDPAVTYTDTLATAKTIVSNAPRGVFDSINVTDDFEIADLNFRVDSITSAGVGDLTVLLRSPGGIGNDFITLIDGLVDLGGPAITNMVIDDDVLSSSTTDMVQASTAQSPYTASWLPVYNSPWVALVNPAIPADTVPELSRYDGASTKGTWTALAADVFSSATGGLDANGSFKAWSIIVTPVHFTCAAVAPPSPNITATKTVAGTYDVGATVTYTVTLTNAGTGAQADNPGAEFTHVLPASLSLVSATATSGTAVATTGTNTVTWDGALIPLGGTTTITITATINANPTPTISNQGAVSFDADGNGTNEATLLTDDPSVGGTADPTVFTMNSAHISGTKTVAGQFQVYGVATYTITLTNDGTAPVTNNVGDEFVDVLPSGLTLQAATATSGSVSVAIVGSAATVRWNGTLAIGASVTITIKTQIGTGTEGNVISNQGTFNYGAFENSANNTTGVTDDPSVGGTTDPTQFTVIDDIFMDGFEGN